MILPIMRHWPAWTLIVPGMLATGCVGTPPRERSAESYAEALRICRGQHTGRSSRDLGLGTDDPHVSDCLRTLGWLADGRPASAAAPE